MKSNLTFLIPLVFGGMAVSSQAQTSEIPMPEFDELQVGLSAMRGAGLEHGRLSTYDPGYQKKRFRGGLIGIPVVDVPAPVYTDPKGGMAAPAKGAVVAPPPAMTHWEVFGGVYYVDQTVDQQIAVAPFPFLVRPEYDLETWGAMAGARYRINENWAVGGMVTYGDSELDANVFGVTAFSMDIDNLAFAPFVEYTQQGIFTNADLHVGFVYAYGMQEYDFTRPLGVVGTVDGDTNTLELVADLAFDAGAVRHGPFVGLRYIDGQTDATTIFTPAPTFVPGVDLESFATTLGYQVSFPIELSGGKLVPQLLVAWEHEFEDDYRVIAVGPSTNVDEDVLVAGAGIGWYADSGWNIVLGYEGRFGDESETHYVGLKAGVTF